MGKKKRIKQFEKDLLEIGFEQLWLDDHSGYWFEKTIKFPVFNKLQIIIEPDRDMLIFSVDYDDETCSREFKVKDVDEFIKIFGKLCSVQLSWDNVPNEDELFDFEIEDDEIKGYTDNKYVEQRYGSAWNEIIKFLNLFECGSYCQIGMIINHIISRCKPKGIHVAPKTIYNYLLYLCANNYLIKYNRSTYKIKKHIDFPSLTKCREIYNQTKYKK